MSITFVGQDNDELGVDGLRRENRGLHVRSIVCCRHTQHATYRVDRKNGLYLRRRVQILPFLALVHVALSSVVQRLLHTCLQGRARVGLFEVVGLGQWAA